MIDDTQKPTGRVGDREGFTEWMDQIMGELDDRRGDGDRGAPGPAGEAERAPVAGPGGEAADGRPRKRLLRWILR